MKREVSLGGKKKGIDLVTKEEKYCQCMVEVAWENLDQLNSSDRGEIKEHLRQCRRCRKELARRLEVFKSFYEFLLES